MPDWTKSMEQSYEYYTVNPSTWRDDKLLRNVKSGSVSRDSSAETLGSASLETTELIGECYVRTYLVTIQNGIKEKHALGTHLVQTPSSSFNGKIRNVTVDAYTPLIELKEKMPPLGYALLKDESVMDNVYINTRTNCRAPVVSPKCDEKLSDDFVAGTSETWLAYNSALMATVKHEYGLDEMGRILFLPKQDTASLQPVWTFDDDNSSILYPEITLDHDIFDIPNVLEVVYSQGGASVTVRVVNDDPNSPVSTVSRGREILHRETSPAISGNPTEYEVKEYATRRLKELSTVEYKVSFTHGYCPVRLGDCVRLNHKSAGLTDVKAKIISQNIKCTPGCPVSAKAVYTNELWR
jgi:hypothetical protein